MASKRSWGICLALFALTGCTDPFVGDWEATDDNACGEKSEFTVDDDLAVSGTIWMVDVVAGVCLECDFDGEAVEAGGDSYDVDIDFDGCNCNGDSSATAECTLNDEEASCELDFGACGKAEDDFEKLD